MLIIMLGVLSRLLWQGEGVSYELAFLCFLYFIFLMKGGQDIGRSYSELLALRLDTEEYNLTLLSTTERVARIGYWRWDMRSAQIELSANLASMYGSEQRSVDKDYCVGKVHEDDKHRVQQAIDNTRESGQENSVEYRFRGRWGR